MKKIIIVVFVLMLGLQPVIRAQNNNFEIAKNLDIFTTLYRELHRNYVDELQSGELMKTAIDAMLKSLDPYTNYIPESDIEDYKFMTTGQYGGIGALIHKKGDYIYISELYEGYPAAKLGLRVGDKILEINNQSAKNKSSEDVSNILKGQPGSSLTILLERPGIENPIVQEIIRENIKIDNIPYDGVLEDSIGYIRLNGFTQNAWKEFREVLNHIDSETPLKGLIIDLRGNGGGLLMEAVNIANFFIEKDQVIVNTKGRLFDKNKTYKTKFAPLHKELPLVILVDGISASASEILAGAIQDLDRGVIIGQRTFGKGLVQNVIPLSYNAKAKVTVAKYYIPSGRCIQAIDYFNKDVNGNSNHIPDSLISEFETRNGRIVYDGGGIEPDMYLEPGRFSNITTSLFTKLLIFDFATEFARKHDSIPPAQDFVISDALFEDFVSFLSDKEYDYVTKSEMALKNLKKHAENEKYFDAIQEDYEILLNKMMHDKNQDLYEFKDEIKKILKIEIASRYYFQKGKLIAALQDDPEIKKAIDILKDTSTYQAILKPLANNSR